MVSVQSMLLGLTAAAVALSSPVSADLQRTLSSLPLYAVPSFDYTSLTEGASPQRLLQALQTEGIVALKNIPNYANLREDFFRRAAECALKSHENPTDNTPYVSKKTFSDGTKRYTISANAGDELGGSAERYTDCPGYQEHYLAFSRALEHAVNTFGSTLDQTSFTASDGHKVISSRKLVSEAVRLDHFHAYEAAPSTADAEAHRRLELSLPLHEDHGLFIAMSAPKYFEVEADGRRLVERELASDASGLVIQTPGGQRVRPVLKPDEVVLMMGTGASRWLKTSHALPAVLHGMKMPESMVSSSEAGRRSLRAWFGKMTLLPAYQRMLESQAAFESHVNATTRYLLTNNDDDLKTVGCATGRHLAASEGKCTVRQCTLKAGVTPPAEACPVICNRNGHSDDDASICAERCDCADLPNPAERCWMLCVANLPTSQCAMGDQTCTGQKITCKATPAPTTPAPTTPAPTTPSPVTPGPTTPAPVTPGPTTPAPVTPGPTTPAPVTPGPTTPAPVTPGPTSDTPAPIVGTPAPTTDRPAC